MPFHPDLTPSSADLAPEMRNDHQGKNHDYLAQAKLIGRYPGDEADWVERYAAKFRELYLKDDGFRDLVNGELDDAAVARIQERLNESN